MLMEFALGSTDLFWVGRLGAAAQDAVTSSMVIIWTIFATISIISVGVTALVSRYIGAKDFERAAGYATQGMSMAVMVSVGVSVIGYLLAPHALRFMDTGENTLLMAVPYIRIFFVTAGLFFVNDTAYAIFRASGDTRTPVKVAMVVIVVNFVLDPILIFGLGPIPAMGVPGASLATGIAVLIGSVLILRQVRKGALGYRLSGLFRSWPTLATVKKIALIGLPISTQQFVFVFVYWFLIKIVHRFGEPAAAAMGIGNRMESLSYLTCYGFSVAASTMVGQNLGAKKPDRAARCAWAAVGSAVALTLVIGSVFLIVPEWIAGIFTSDPQVRKIAVAYLMILGLSQAAMALEIVLEGAFGGAGDTLPPMAVSIPGALVRVPLAYYLCFNLGWGINGVWWTLTITSFAKSIVLVTWFRLGNWKRKEL
jgi:putative MATE family efflux protein